MDGRPKRLCLAVYKHHDQCVKRNDYLSSGFIKLS